MYLLNGSFDNIFTINKLITKEIRVIIEVSSIGFILQDSKNVHTKLRTIII